MAKGYPPGGGSYNVLTLPAQIADLTVTTAPTTIKVQCGLADDALRKRVWAVYRVGGIPQHPYDGTRVLMTGDATVTATISGLINDTEYGVRIFVEGQYGYQTDLEGATARATPRAGQRLSEIPEGNFISLNENSTPVLFYVAKHGYEPELNGPGRSLVVRKDCHDKRQWDTSNINAYATSSIDSWLNGTYKNLLGADIRALIGTTKFYYTPGNGNNTVTELARSVFLLSVTELGETSSHTNVEGSALPIASILQIAQLNGSAVAQWTRSPDTRFTSAACALGSSGSVGGDSGGSVCSNAFGSRPAFTLPSDMLFFVTPNADGSYSPIL